MKANEAQYIEIDDINCRYMIYGDKGRPVVLLHGWGQNLEMMAYIAVFLKEHFKVYSLDLPGFGASSEPIKAYTVEDYATWLHKFLEELEVTNPIIIAHSFGCRIAFHYAYKYPVYKMCLTGAAGLRPPRSIGWYIRTYSYKLVKSLIVVSPFKGLLKNLQDNVGSTDYRNASGVMRETLVKVVNDDVRDLLPQIDVETLLVFGSKDDATPLSSGQQIEKLLPNGTLVVFEGDDHYAYFHQAARFNAVLEAFLKRDYYE